MGLDMYVTEYRLTNKSDVRIKDLIDMQKTFDMGKRIALLKTLIYEMYSNKMTTEVIEDLSKKLYNAGEYYISSALSRLDLDVESAHEKVEDLEQRLKEYAPISANFFDAPLVSKKDSMYWRKANAIHHWFVQNVQYEVDDCHPYFIDLTQMIELDKTIGTILTITDQEEKVKLASELLPPVEGFFFGSQELDEYYFNDLQETKDWLDKIVDWEGLENGTIVYEYQSSW